MALPESGDCLTRDDQRAAEIARDNEQQRKAALERARSMEAKKGKQEAPRHAP